MPAICACIVLSNICCNRALHAEVQCHVVPMLRWPVAQVQSNQQVLQYMRIPQRTSALCICSRSKSSHQTLPSKLVALPFHLLPLVLNEWEDEGVLHCGVCWHHARRVCARNCCTLPSCTPGLCVREGSSTHGSQCILPLLFDKAAIHHSVHPPHAHQCPAHRAQGPDRSRRLQHSCHSLCDGHQRCGQLVHSWYPGNDDLPCHGPFLQRWQQEAKQSYRDLLRAKSIMWFYALELH